jgi:hypothetical protein
MALTLETEQRLRDVDLIDFFEQNRDDIRCGVALLREVGSPDEREDGLRCKSRNCPKSRPPRAPHQCRRMTKRSL